MTPTLIHHIHYFEEWRDYARKLLVASIPPEEVHWQVSHQEELFGDSAKTITSQNELVHKPHNNNTTIRATFNVPKAFIELAQCVAYYRCDDRWALLYRTLWRLTHNEPYLLNIASDADVMRLHKMAKAVRRDSHKMKAFVRFRKSTIITDGDIEEHFIAWHQASHFTLRRTAPFFARRFATMKWAILTPDDSVYWDGKQLRFGKGCPRNEAPSKDDVEELWKTFYWNIFNPARIKVNMMKSEMPMKFWHTLPEAALIPDMLKTSNKRVSIMIDASRRDQALD